MKLKLNTHPTPTVAELLQQLDRLDAIADAAAEVVSLSRHWFPVRGDRLAHAKSVQDPAALEEVWNAARRLETLLYPPECTSEDKAARAEGRDKAVAFFPQVALILVWPVTWVRLLNAVEDLLRKHDDFLSHLDWLGLFLGGGRKRPGMEPKPKAIAPHFLDLLEGRAEYLRTTIRQARQAYSQLPLSAHPTPQREDAPPAPSTPPADGTDRQREDAPHPDGPEGGRWLWWKNVRYAVPKGTVYRLLEYMWDRNSGKYDDLIDIEVFESAVAPGTFRSYANKANNKLPPGFPWRLSADSINRQLTKVPAAKGAQPESLKNP